MRSLCLARRGCNKPLTTSRSWSWTQAKRRLNAPKKQRRYYSGKKKRHTLKSQIVIDRRNKQIICAAHCRGAQHDFALYKQSGVKPQSDIKCLGDSGYQGLDKLHANSQTPEKKRRGQKFSPEAKGRNRELARLRIVVEHVLHHLKIFRILAERYRNRRRCFSLRFNLIAGLYNFELNLD
ncbi:MAG TPA: transposase family protein [Blastocatellia bacterium]|nr:transposase family protein [Blastocatellia bacterium]